MVVLIPEYLLSHPGSLQIKADYLISSYFSADFYLDNLVGRPKSPVPVEYIVTPDCQHRLEAAKEQRAKEEDAKKS
jgi:hypothetical protein